MAELLTDKNEIGVIIARMQVPYLTDSHKKVIQTVLDRHKRVYLFLGVDNRKDLKKNPYSYVFRKQMIEQEFNFIYGAIEKYYSEKVIVLPLFDNYESDEDWVKCLDAQIQPLISPKTARLYGGRDSFLDIYKKWGGKYETQELSAEDYDSGTELRELSASSELNYSQEVAIAILVTQQQFLK